MTVQTINSATSWPHTSPTPSLLTIAPQILHRPTIRLGVLALPLLVSACAALNAPGNVPAESAIRAAIPAEWQTTLPHNGQTGELRRWWQSLGDPLLVELINSAQVASPTLASALSRINQARAAQSASGAALKPVLDATLGASRGVTQPATPIANTFQAGLQAGWEIDLFGANRLAWTAASERLGSAQAQWHDARVSVAAEVANQYIGLRSCDLQLALVSADAASRAETARLSGLTTRAGFTAPALDALARASAADAANRVEQQRAQCEVGIKAMVAVTDMPEVPLKQKFALVAPAFTATFSVPSVPAEALSQRPDLLSAQRDIAAASADLGATEAQRYPRLSLSGSVGALSYNAGAFSNDLATWSIGPLALSIPLWDGGRRAANVEAAQARYVEAEALYRARVRQAVREVEESLVNLRSVALRADHTQIAAQGYRASFTATQARFGAGLANLPELEESRRTALGADTALLTLQRDRMLAWVALYRAVGGGWNVGDAVSIRP